LLVFVVDTRAHGDSRNAPKNPSSFRNIPEPTSILLNR
jgi:hypothetical protein